MGAPIKHLEISHNHEAGLIPFATQQYIRQQQAEIEKLRDLLRVGIEVSADQWAEGIGRWRDDASAFLKRQQLP
jgi:hypothetical protein